MASRYWCQRQEVYQNQQQNNNNYNNNNNRNGYDGNMQQRCFPIHVAYMGFAGSCGSSTVWDYSIFDTTVVPLDNNIHDDEDGDGDGGGGGGTIRRQYDEALVYMPHLYFVNSHKSVIGGWGDGIMVKDINERNELRLKYGIPRSAFVYCCHSWSDKIDP